MDFADQPAWSAVALLSFPTMPSLPDRCAAHNDSRAKMVLVDMPGYGFAYAHENQRQDWKGLVSPPPPSPLHGLTLVGHNYVKIGATRCMTLLHLASNAAAEQQKSAGPTNHSPILPSPCAEKRRLTCLVENNSFWLRLTAYGDRLRFSLSCGGVPDDGLS